MFNVFSDEEIKTLIMKSPNKSSSLDPLPTQLLKQCIDILIPVITEIINKSLKSGCFPDILKNAIVTPIMKNYKSGTIYTNYRPISNLPFLSKIIEKAVLTQCIPFLQSTEKFAQNNSAYKKYHSTETLLTKISSDIVTNISNKQITMLVLLDLSAAFDSVNHSTLIDILRNRFNVQSAVLSWFKSFFQDRSQRIRINNSFSKKLDIHTGVPQGSCIGPVAFLIYVSALSEIANRHGISLQSYADDTQIYISTTPSKSHLHSKLQILQQCLDEIITFLLTHQLQLNDSKT